MANYSFSRLERAYLQKQPTFGTIPNTSGTASVSNSNACRFMRMELQNEVALLERPDKTGTRSQEGMTSGRKVGRWSIEMSLAANGTAGTVPDCDPLLVATFGQTAAVGTGSVAVSSSTDATPIVVTSATHGIASGALEVVTIAGHTVNTNANGTWLAYANSTTSLTLIGSTATGTGTSTGGATGTVSRAKLTYTFVDDITQFTLWSFRTASTLDQRVGHTCVVTEVIFNLNQDVATWQANGDCLWVLRSKDFSTADVYQAAGLTTFPSEPTTPVTNGSIIPGFTGRFVAGASSTTASVYAAAAVAFPTIRNATIRVQTNNLLVRDTFGSYYPTMTEGDVRNVALTFNIYDDDSPAVNTLKTWGDSKVPVDFVLNIGTVVGNTWIHYLKNVYLAAHVLGDGQLRFDASYADSRATASSLSVKDEYSLIIA
jgi:hypothetical protein